MFFEYRIIIIIIFNNITECLVNENSIHIKQMFAQ